jgi:SAM-dependent methyltransferase
VRSHAVWEAMAPGWERDRAFIWDASNQVGEWMVERLDPQPGQTILELAAGPGDTGFLAAARLGEGGRLISTDFSPAMVEVARHRGAELGLINVEYRVLDAERMDLDDASADGVLCRFGYMLMADPATALRETRRVLRRGGRLVMSVWGDPGRNPWAAVVGRVLVERGHLPPPTPDQPGVFSMASPERVSELVSGAGFGEPEIEEMEVVWQFEDEDAYWRFLLDLAGAVSMLLADLSAGERDDVRRETMARLGSFRDNGALRLPGLSLNAVAS